MARLRHIQFTPHHFIVENGQVQKIKRRGSTGIADLPQIMWESSLPWREANLWALQRATEGGVKVETVQANMTSLLTYANWLEATNTDWWDFPIRKADRCLVRFRGFLTQSRDDGIFSPSTATQRMRDVLNFYRWLTASGLLSSEWPLWQERTIGIHMANTVGLQRTMMVKTTDLAIKNRRSDADLLEDGLLPVSSKDRDTILEFAFKNSSWEIYLLLLLGFFTGMRLGTLCDLRVETLEKATEEPRVPGLFKLYVGPGARPPVSTKFDVTGSIWITSTHLELIRTYIGSPRRKSRVAQARPEDQSLVFLTRYGNPFVKKNRGRSSAINVEMHSLRKKAKAQNLRALEGFHFHQTRCTFATNLASLLIPKAGAVNAISIVKEALLHKDEATSLKYIKFVERTPAIADAANAFTQAFLGTTPLFKVDLDV
ncbi:TPA: site-specific integrase [Pseudomonas putida]|nr:site-specific integrase [Pseudomonas putida]